jgi:predicted RNase H-like HicB family nuclease
MVLRGPIAPLPSIFQSRTALLAAGLELQDHGLADERLWPPTFTAVIRQDGPWWLGWVEEVPGVNALEHTREELLASLRQVLHEALEFYRHEAL